MFFRIMIFSFFFLIANSDSAPAQKGASEKLEGSWVIDLAKSDGRKKDELKGYILTFQNGKIQLAIENEVLDEGEL